MALLVSLFVDGFSVVIVYKILTTQEPSSLTDVIRFHMFRHVIYVPATETYHRRTAPTSSARKSTKYNALSATHMFFFRWR